MRILVFIAAFIFISCKKNENLSPVDFSPAPCADTTSFMTEIKPQIMDQSCNISGCHDASASGGLKLETHAELPQTLMLAGTAWLETLRVNLCLPVVCQ